MDISQIRLTDIQPSQFFISRDKLARIEKWFDPRDLSNFEPVTVKLLDGVLMFTDGHTRAYAAWRAGLERIPLMWEPDEWDWDAYRIDIAACRRRGVRSIADLEGRLLTGEEYQRRWMEWCDAVHEVLDIQREAREHD